MDYIQKLQLERNGFRKFIPAEYSDRIMSLNRLEERNYQKRIGYIQKENRININAIERDMYKISLELDDQKKLIEKSKNEQKLRQLNVDLDNLIQNSKRVKSAAYSLKLDYCDKQNEFDKNLASKIFYRNQTAKTRKLSNSRILLGKRASTAHPMLRETKPPSPSNSIIETNNNQIVIKKDDSKLSDDSSDAIFTRVKRVKSSSIGNVLRKTPLSVKSAKPDALRQMSLPSFTSNNNDLSKVNVLIKFEEIFYNLI